MSLRSYIILMLLATGACYLCFFAVIYFFDPFSGGVGAMAFFHASLFLSLLGTFSILGLLLRLIFTKNRLIFKMVSTSFRQGVWFSLLIITILLLQKFALFSWFNIVILIFALAILEIFFMSYKSKNTLKI